ncbi:MAG TPA: hypothetical protein VLB47_12610 [Solirubrobacteraceae bacterium]|nr:hypothetical protein [Solirubrobacteraceae bacterium]
MTPRDIPGPLALESLGPSFAVLRDAGTPQAPRAAAAGADRADPRRPAQVAADDGGWAAAA